MLGITVDGTQVNYDLRGDISEMVMDTMKVIRTIEYELRRKNPKDADMYRDLVVRFIPENVWSEECTITEEGYGEKSGFRRGSEDGPGESDKRVEDKTEMDG